MADLNVRLRLMADVRDFASRLGTAVSSARQQMSGLTRTVGKGADAFGATTAKAKGFFTTLRENIVTQMKTGLMFATLYQALITFRAVIGGSIDELLGLDEALRKVQSISKDSDETIEELKQQLIKAAREGKLFGQTAREVADGMFEIVQAGFNTADAFEIATVAAQAATAGFTDAATSGKVITGALLAFGMEASKARAVADVLFQTVDTGVVTFEELANGLGVAMSPAAQMKVSLEELGAAIAIMTRRGIPAHRAMTSLTRILFGFLDPSDKAFKAAESLGFSLSAQTVKTHGLEGAMRMLYDAAEGNEEALADVFDRQRALVGAFSLLSDGGAEWTEILKVMNTATADAGALQEAFDERSKALTYRLRELKAQVFSLMTTALDPLLGKYFAPFIGFLSDIIKDKWGVVAFFRDNAAAAEILKYALAGLTLVLGALLGGPFTLLGAIAAFMIGAGGPGEALRLLGDGIAYLADKAGILRPITLAFQDLEYTFDKMREGDLTGMGLGISLFIERLTGVKVPVTEVRKHLRNLEIAGGNLRDALARFKEGDFQTALQNVRWAVFQVFGPDVLAHFDKFTDVVKEMVEPWIAFGVVVKEEALDVLTALGDLIQNFVIPAYIRLVTYFADKVFPAIHEFVTAVAPVMTKAIRNIGTVLEMFIAEVGPVIVDIWERINKAIIDVIPILLDFARNVIEIVGAIQNWLVESGAVETFIIGMKTALEGAREAWDFLWPVVRKVFDWIANNKPVLIALITALGILLVVLNPIPAAIIGIIFALGWLRQNWDRIIEVVTSVIKKIQELPVIGEIIEGLTIFVTSMIDDFIDQFENIISIGEHVIDFFKHVFSGEWEEAWEDIKKIAVDVLKLFIGFLKFTFIDDVLEVFYEMVPGVKGTVDKVVGFFRNLPARLRNWLGNIGGAAKDVGVAIKDGIIDGISATAEFIADWATAMKDLLADVINHIIDAIDEAIPDDVGVGPFKLDLPNNPVRGVVGTLTGASFAEGVRNFMGGLAMVGERGAELLRLPRGTDVIRHADIGQAMRGERERAVREAVTQLVRQTFFIETVEVTGDPRESLSALGLTELASS